MSDEWSWTSTKTYELRMVKSEIGQTRDILIFSFANLLSL